MKYCTLLFFCWIYSIHFSQEKKIKLKEGGDFTYVLEINNEKITGTYVGTYIKEKIEGDKVELPYGQGKFTSSLLTFEGEWIDGKMNGNGLLQTTNYKYSGSFILNVKNGVGRAQYTNGDNYNGEWSNDLPNGKGEFIYSNGMRYSGQIVNGLKNGFGIYAFINDFGRFCNNNSRVSQYNTYEGQFIDDKFNGQGQLKLKDGSICIGIWDNEIFTGKGRICFSNGNEYNGDIIKNVATGKGSIKFANNDFYNGDVVDGVIIGVGSMKYQDGSEYIGTWKDNKKDGAGVLTTNDKFKWDGNWVNGIIDGIMKVYNPEGNIITSGLFINNKINGIGFNTINGNKYEGEWNNGVIGLKGKITFENGNFYEGEWIVEDVTEDAFSTTLQGKGKMVFSNGSIYEGDWSNGYAHGKGKFLTADNQVFEGEFRENEFVKPFNPKTTQIGTQVWMSEDLAIERFANGDLIPQVTSIEEAKEAIQNHQPAWCYYNFDPQYGQTYGKMYNLYAVKDSRGFAPIGWHLPSGAELKKTIDYLGGANVKQTYRKLKSKSYDFYVDPQHILTNYGNNESGFNGIPGGTFGIDSGFALENTHVFYICDDFKSILILCFESDMGEHESIKIGGFTILAGEKSTLSDNSFYYVRLVK